jgi:hypothetical protein
VLLALGPDLHQGPDDESSSIAAPYKAGAVIELAKTATTWSARVMPLSGMTGDHPCHVNARCVETKDIKQLS